MKGLLFYFALLYGTVGVILLWYCGLLKRSLYREEKWKNENITEVTGRQSIQMSVHMPVIDHLMYMFVSNVYTAI